MGIALGQRLGVGLENTPVKLQDNLVVVVAALVVAVDAVGDHELSGGVGRRTQSGTKSGAVDAAAAVAVIKGSGLVAGEPAVAVHVGDEVAHDHKFNRNQRNDLLDKILEYYTIHYSSLSQMQSLEVLRALFV